MITKEELQNKYATLSTGELIDILDNKLGYTDLAVAVAIDELSKRNPSEEEIKSYKEGKLEELNTFVAKNVSEDLTVVQKMLFYIFWIPLFTFAFKRNYREDGFVLKLRQANYYSFIGFLVLISSAIITAPSFLSNLTEVGVWMLGFFPAYLFDEYFNRQQQIKKLNKIFKINDMDETNKDIDDK